MAKIIEREEDDARTGRRPACDGTPRRSNHSSIGTSAIATTSAAVTGRKNSAPARSANGRPMISADAGDQGQRGQQPVALDGDAPRPARARRRSARRRPVRAWSLAFMPSADHIAQLAAPPAGFRYRGQCWCPWSDSNGHSLRNSILSSSASTIPPQGHAWAA